MSHFVLTLALCREGESPPYYIRGDNGGTSSVEGVMLFGEVHLLGFGGALLV